MPPIASKTCFRKNLRGVSLPPRWILDPGNTASKVLARSISLKIRGEGISFGVIAASFETSMKTTDSIRSVASAPGKPFFTLWVLVDPSIATMRRGSQSFRCTFISGAASRGTAPSRIAMTPSNSRNAALFCSQQAFACRYLLVEWHQLAVRKRFTCNGTM